MQSEFRVLIVEDSDVIAQLINIMTADALITERVSSLAAGLARACDESKPPVDAVVLDLNLPNGAGISTIKRFRAKANVPVVVFTGEAIDKDEALQAGAASVLYKPAGAEDIYKNVVDAIARKQSGDLAAPLVKAIVESKDLCDVKRPGSDKTKKGAT